MSDPKTSIDWLRFRTQADPLQALEALRPMFGTLAPHLALKGGQRGILGFQQAASITVADMVVGRADFGGESQRGWVRFDIPGKGCSWVTDWDALAEVEALPSCEIRRLDIALTTWKREVTHNCVVSAHEAGRFAGSRAGRPPSLRQIISSDPRAGKTCEIGKREKADKFFRGYEKGFEVASKLPESISATMTHLEGFPLADIYRCEVELKPETRPIPWEVVERRDQYFAGSYPFLADLLPGVEADILQRRPDRHAQRTLAAALENCRIQYGATLFTALAAHHGDVFAIWSKICGTAHNKNLLEEGVLLVDHDEY
jgi:phage replication initiation protein